MSGRPERRTPQQQRELGQAVWIARDAGVVWKVLENVYGRSRLQLWRYARAWQGAMKQNSPAMKHPRRCDTETGSASLLR